MPDEEPFYHLLADVYDLLFPVTDAQRGFFVELAGKQGVSRVLDVACGSGEQAALFRELGLHVSALEYDERMVECVRAKGLAIDVRLGSMEHVAELFTPGYDLVLCIGNSLPHLPRLAAVERAVRGMVSLLNQGGLLVLSTVNFDRVIRDRITSLPTKRIEDSAGRSIVFERFYDLAPLPAHITFSTRLSVHGTARTASVALVPISPEWLSNLVVNVGLRVTGSYADFSRSPFAPQAASLVLVAARGEGHEAQADDAGE